MQKHSREFNPRCTGRPATRRRAMLVAFTLVELLAVIAIIALLMGILVPSVNSARRQAKRSKSSSMVGSIGKGAEMFRNEMNRYPKSSGGNPFESSSYGGAPSVFLSGAQWLALELVGADLRGFVKPDSGNNSPGSDPAGSEKIDDKDWLDWYSNSPKREYSRIGPFVTIDGKIAQSPDSYAAVNPGAGASIPASLRNGSSEWSNGKIPFFVDAFNFPVLYYTANTAERTNPFWKNANTIGRYDQTDNAQFTGADGNNGRYTGAGSETGWDLSGSGNPHPFKTLGYTDPRTATPRDSFAGQVSDQNIFNTTQDGGGKGKVWPHNADSFLIITPGPDGLYGNEDDVRNYQTQN